MSRTVKVIVAVAAGILVLLAGLVLVGLYYIGSPPEKFKVLSVIPVDDNGWPSLLVRFETNKYPIKFLLIDSMGKIVDEMYATEGEDSVTHFTLL